MVNFNNVIFSALNGFVGWSTAFDQTIVFFAEHLGYIMIAGFLALILFSRISKREKQKFMMGAVVATVAGRGIIVEGIRFFYNHPRPFTALGGARTLFLESGYSFPSAHATFFFALSAIVYRYNKGWGTLFFTLSV